MADRPPQLPTLFVRHFSVDEATPFRRHLNRLEVEVGGEDYRHLKKVELLPRPPAEADFQAMEEITERLIATTQNNYNRNLLRRLGIRVYFDVARYAIYYRLADRVLRFTAAWRRQLLHRLFHHLPVTDTGWVACRLPALSLLGRFLPDGAGGVLLLRRPEAAGLPLLTATHAPYDPHTLEMTLFLLQRGRGGSAVVNLGFSGREPLTDENLGRLRGWGVPLNPSSIDVIYPYADAAGHPFCYKLEENLPRYVGELGGAPPSIIIDLHGCVGTRADDERLIVGLGGLPPFPQPTQLGRFQEDGDRFQLTPHRLLRRGLGSLAGLGEIYVQFCSGPHRGYHLHLSRNRRLIGRGFDPRVAVKSLIEGEERHWLPGEAVRWLPGAGGNALQRLQARRLRPDTCCLHVEIPLHVRRTVAEALALPAEDGFLIV